MLLPKRLHGSPYHLVQPLAFKEPIRSIRVCARLMSLFRTSSPETVLKTRSYVGKAEFGPESQSRTPWLEVGSWHTVPRMLIVQSWINITRDSSKRYLYSYVDRNILRSSDSSKTPLSQSDVFEAKGGLISQMGIKWYMTNQLNHEENKIRYVWLQVKFWFNFHGQKSQKLSKHQLFMGSLS